MTAIGTTPSRSSRLARQPLSPDCERRDAAPVTASGHENSEGDRVTAIGHSDQPGEQAKATAATSSGQTAATGHARAISEGPLAVRKPPPATPKPLERTQ